MGTLLLAEHSELLKLKGWIMVGYNNHTLNFPQEDHASLLFDCKIPLYEEANSTIDHRRADQDTWGKSTMCGSEHFLNHRKKYQNME